MFEMPWVIFSFVLFWTIVGVVWGGLAALGMHKKLLQRGFTTDALCGLLGFAVAALLFCGNVHFSQHIVGIFIVIPVSKLFQDFVAWKLGDRRTFWRP